MYNLSVDGKFEQNEVHRTVDKNADYFLSLTWYFSKVFRLTLKPTSL